ncbi:MAG: ATP-dependent helicase [Sulfurovum sp.]|nr:ATP-dependent helicase [Sulfurovum sp.]
MPLNRLNQEQLKAATAASGQNLVIASAGTGKTSTIVGRIVHLLQEGVEPEKILLLTFTNKAAGEMIARLGAFFPKKIVDRIESGTFHAVCYRWLKKITPSLSLKQPSELKTLFRSVYEKRQFTRLGHDVEPFSATYLYEMYQLYQNASLESFDMWFLELYPDHEPLMDIYLDICDEFERTKQDYGFVSFNDLLLHTKEYVTDNHIHFTEILVDEYQDTNTLQGALIDTLRSDSLFCVGDYDQSIYAFNGANIKNISTFAERYSNAKVFTLTKNYRSVAPILSLANRVIERNERIYPKKLEVGRVGDAHSPRLLIYDELFEQYQSISRQIKKSHLPNEHIAVIFRNNSSADGIEASLRDLGLPCKRKGGASFFDAKEVKFLLDILALMTNPKDMMAFIHIFEYGKGIGTALSKEFFLCLVHFGNGNLMRGILHPEQYDLPKLNPNKNMQLGLFDDDLDIGSVSRFKDINISEALRSHPLLKHPKLSVDGLKFFISFYQLMKSVQQSRVPKSILAAVIDSDLYAVIVDILSTQRARLKTGEVDQEKKGQSKDRILRKAGILLNLSSHYKELNRFVNAMILGGGELSEGEGVNLLTVHASKGLEFTEVFVVDLMDTRFPNHKLMNKSGGALEEERRLFYVAVTRAKDRLSLSYAKYDRVRKIDFKPSLFLFETGLLKGEPIYPNEKE